MCIAEAIDVVDEYFGSSWDGRAYVAYKLILNKLLDRVL